MSSEICRVCQKESASNNLDLNILGVHICKNCLNNIAEANIGTVKYGYYKQVIKKMWIDYIMANC